MYGIMIFLLHFIKYIIEKFRFKIKYYFRIPPFNFDKKISTLIKSKIGYNDIFVYMSKNYFKCYRNQYCIYLRYDKVCNKSNRFKNIIMFPVNNTNPEIDH